MVVVAPQALKDHLEERFKESGSGGVCFWLDIRDFFM